jgi:hypothetical protein
VQGIAPEGASQTSSTPANDVYTNHPIEEMLGEKCPDPLARLVLSRGSNLDVEAPQGLVNLIDVDRPPAVALGEAPKVLAKVPQNGR